MYRLQEEGAAAKPQFPPGMRAILLLQTLLLAVLAASALAAVFFAVSVSPPPSQLGDFARALARTNVSQVAGDIAHVSRIIYESRIPRVASEFLLLAGAVRSLNVSNATLRQGSAAFSDLYRIARKMLFDIYQMCKLVHPERYDELCASYHDSNGDPLLRTGL